MPIRKIDALRFWIGDDKKRISSVWRIWGKNGQVYATSKSFGGKVKLSIHTPDDDCQFGLDRQSQKLLPGVSEDERFIRWKRCRPKVDQAATIAVLQFPTDYLNGCFDVPELAHRKFGTSIPTAPNKMCVEVGIFSKLGSDVRNFSEDIGPFKAACHLGLGEDQLCVVGFRHTFFDKSFLPEEEKLTIPEAKISEGLNQVLDDKDFNQLNLCLWNTPSDNGFLRLTELSGVKFRRN